MTVADLQKFVANLGELLSSSKAGTVVAELSALADGLGPFRDKTLKEFVAFLAWAERAKREGVPPSKPVKQKAPRGEVPPAITVEQATEVFKALYERALQADVTPELVAAEVMKLGGLKKGELDAVARGVGLHQKLKTKGEVMAALQARVLGRKGMNERAGL